MGKALAALDVKRAAARGGAPRGKRDAALVALGKNPTDGADPGEDPAEHEALLARIRQWHKSRETIRDAYAAEARSKLKAVDDAPRSPHLPDLPAGLALRCLVPWGKGRRPPASCLGEMHLPKHADAGGNSLRCWRIAPPGKLYLLGGSPESKEVVCWDMAARGASAAWDDLAMPDLPIPIQCAQAAWLKGKLYIVGGSVGICPHNADNPEYVTYAKHTFCWDPARPGDGWQRMADLLAGRSYHGMAVLGGRLWVVGGTGEGEDDDEMDSVERYDPAMDAWEAVTPMCYRRMDPAVAVLDGKIYAVGGTGSRGLGAWGILQSCERYHPDTNAWEVLPDIPTHHNMSAAAPLDGKLWVAGGLKPGGNHADKSKTVAVFNPASNTWETKADLITGRSCHSLEVIGGDLYAVGGDHGVTSVEKYNLQADSWSTVAGMALPEQFSWGACRAMRVI